LLAFSLPANAQDQYFPSPVRIAQGESGQILVVDSLQEAVISWKPGRQGKASTISVPGRPVSVAAGWNRFFVGNERTQTVDVVNKKGRLLYTLGGDGVYIPRPSDIALDIDQGLVFVTDPIGARVLIFDKAGALLQTIPAAGQKALKAPTGIFVDTLRGEILVSDFEAAGNWFSAAGGVLIYDYQGNHLATVAGNQPGGYDFARPQGIAVNTQGLIYLVDSFRGQVLIFDRETQLGVATLGEVGSEPGRLLLPLDILIDPDSNDVYVTNNRNQRIEVFRGKGVQP